VKGLNESQIQRYGVWVYERFVGVLQSRGDYTRFLIDPNYWDDPERPVLGLRFEDRPSDIHAAALRLPPWFSNLLPEGRLRDWIAIERGVSRQREMLLLAHVGHDLPGAVRITPDVQPPGEWETGEVEAGRSNLRPLEHAETWKFSLAGVALKFSLLQQGDRLTVPAGGQGGDWIVKFPHAEFPGVPRNEYAMMMLARTVGITVPETKLHIRTELPDLPPSLWPGEENEAYAVRRFDRGPGGGLVHIEDFAQVRGFYAEDKYRGSFETVASLAYRGHDVASLQEFARRLVFCVLIGNGDGHLKNWSLVYPDRRNPNLAPAYDLVATAAYRRHSDGPEDLGLKFSNSRRFESVTLSRLGQLQHRLRASSADLEDVAADVIAKVMDNWPKVAELFDGYPQLAARIDQHIARSVKTLRGASIS